MSIVEMEKQIEDLNMKILLSNSPEQRELLLNDISKLKKAINSAKETERPVVVPIKDAPTVGDKIEKKLKGLNSRATILTDNRLIL